VTNYTKGRAFEYELVQMFRDAGYEVARTAGSHGPWDVVATKTTARSKKIAFIAMVQAKVKKR